MYPGINKIKMIQRLRIILMLGILLSSAIGAQAQKPLPEKVFIGTGRSYWVDGLEGSTYSWKINGVLQGSTTHRIEVTWLSLGVFILEVQEHQANCDGEVRSSEVEVLDLVPPTFAAVNSYCTGASIADLPTTSMNSITGSWAPAIDNRQTTTYTFTPTTGQGAATATLNIEIVKPAVPEFEAIGPLCWNSSASGLPLISTNGILGTWSPSTIATNLPGTATYTFFPRADQCAVSKDLVIETSDPIIITETHIDIDNVNPSGSIDLTVSGGTGLGTYSYRWSNDATTEDLANLPAGTYKVIVTDKNGCQSTLTIRILNASGQAPIACNDEFVTSCSMFRGDLLNTDNGHGIDYDPDGETLFVEMTPIVLQHGLLILNQDGSFIYEIEPRYKGDVDFRYRIYDEEHNFSTPVTVIIHVISDMDHDGIADAIDPDADGDGILNIYEALPGVDWQIADVDGDGLLNYLDIDSDGDGIVDNVESQCTAAYKTPSNLDVNANGVDDAYDVYRIKPIDTDGDGIPDFLDLDADNDMVPDYIEGHDPNADGKPDHYATGNDSDIDGLDDGYDLVVKDCDVLVNAMGSNATMQDFDGDGMPDWRDENDDNDIYPTKYEDLNADGDFSNDDIDFDGSPEYLDFGRDCDLFIPEAFSPNGDGVHDYYQLYCINHYPNAIIYIFNQLGNKIFEKAHYGNLEFWGSFDRAWWSGKPDRGPGYSTNDLVTPGTYFYVLDLGNGVVKKSFVFVSY